MLDRRTLCWKNNCLGYSEPSPDTTWLQSAAGSWSRDHAHERRCNDINSQINFIRSGKISNQYYANLNGTRRYLYRHRNECRPEKRHNLWQRSNGWQRLHWRKHLVSPSRWNSLEYYLTKRQAVWGGNPHGYFCWWRWRVLYKPKQWG